MKFIKTLGLSTYYQMLIFTRLKQAVFFTLFFPIFLYIVFNSLWGQTDEAYAFYLLTGVISMLIASDGFFAIGPVVKQFYASGFIKYVKKMPVNIIMHFLALILSRFAILALEILILILLGTLLFGVTTDIQGIGLVLVGTMAGLTIFSFLGLSLSFLDLKSSGEKSITSILYFVMLFTSEAFYPTKMLNPIIGTLGDYLPMNTILSIMRPEVETNWILLAVWMIIPAIAFILLFNRSKVTR